MQPSIFSTYSKTENLITASILSVMQHLSLNRIERIFGSIMEDSDFELIKFKNQPSGQESGVPDALISGNFKILIETKIVKNAVKSKQLERHLKRLDKNNPAHILLVLTPDSKTPQAIEKIASDQLIWTSFSALDQAIEELFKDEKEIISEREAFLLRNLQIMMEENELFPMERDVLVIPARIAWRDYALTNAYVCQDKRTFQPSKYLAFYTNNRIYKFVPKIQKIYESVVFEKNKHHGRLGTIVNTLLEKSFSIEGESYKVILLSSQSDKETIVLDNEITNDLRSKNGRRVAFTQNQRYISLENLKNAKFTSELVQQNSLKNKALSMEKNNQWSDSLIQDTLTAINECRVSPLDGKLHLKNASGQYGYITLQDLLKMNLEITDKQVKTTQSFSNEEDLLAAGWVVD